MDLQELSQYWREFLVIFIPLFVAMDAVGVLPIFLGLTHDLPPARRNQLVTTATLTVLVISVIFLFTGSAVFRFLGITENDFRVGGGLVLLAISISDLAGSHEDDNRKPASQNVGIVPIGIPLIMGPAALTTLLIGVESYGYWITGIAMLANLAIVWFSFRYAHYIVRVIGTGGARAFAKVASLFIAAIAVMMIRVGVTGYITAF